MKEEAKRLAEIIFLKSLVWGLQQLIQSLQI